ncbi:hypothetical protein niasHT_021368 [Heterodera trifolii]|uniref:F-box domain-containing protein n=1 Tax=Heterodera trifolii TaxID=157864 RepID=A0ABD2K6V9_9BILA
MSSEIERKRRYLPAEVWHAILGFMCRSDLSVNVALTCARFSVFSDEWLAKRCGRVLPPVDFHRFRLLKRGHDRSVAYRASLQTREGSKNMPIAEVPPPAHFNHFSSVNIRYFDGQVLSFLRNMKRLFVDVKLFLFYRFGKSNFAAFGQIVPLLASSGHAFSLIIDCALDKTSDFGLICQHHAQIIEQSVRLLVINYYFCTDFGRRITGAEMEEEISLLLRWLHQTESPRGGGKARLLAILRPSVEFRDRLIELVLETFLNAQCSANFLIRFEHTDNPSSYTLVFRHSKFSFDNASTREQCTLRQFDQQNWLFRRGPSAADNERLGNGAEEGKKETEEEERKLVKELLEVWDRPEEGWPTSAGCRDRQAIVLNCDNYQCLFGPLEEVCGAFVEDDTPGPSQPKRLHMD